MKQMNHTSAPLDSLAPKPASARTDHAAPSIGTGQAEQPFLRLDFKRSLQMHWRLTALIVTLGLLASAGFVALRWPVYIAQSVVYIQPSAPQVLSKDAATNWPNDANAYDTFIQQKVQSASNSSVLTSALHKLPIGSWQQANESEQAATLRLGHAIAAKRMGTSYQISITAKAHDADQSAQIANAVAAAMVDNAAREASAGNAERIAALQTERARVQKTLDADRAEQDAINAKLGIAAVGTATPNHFDADITQLHESLIKARADREESAARLSAMSGGAASGLNAEADEQLNADLGMVGLKTSLNQRRAVLIAQMANLTPNHPQYKQDADELAHIDNTLDSTLKEMRAKATARIQQKLRTDLTRSTELEERLNAQLARMTGAAAGATPEMQRAYDLATEIARLQGRYGAIDEQFNNLKLETSAAGAASIASPAVPPQKPDAMAVLHVAVPVAIFGILMGLFAALIAHNLDPRVYTAADVERILGCTPMAQLPDFNQVSPGVEEEHLLRLAASLEHAWQQGAVKHCILTACAPGAGTTTIAARLKDLLEGLGRQALFVSASAAQSTASPSEQNRSAESSGLLATRQMNRSMTMLQKLTEDAAPDSTKEDTGKLVLTDTAPLAISAETEYLARNADATILVVQSGVTTGEQLRKASETLQRLQASSVGIVLNRIHLQHADPHFRQSVQMLEKKLKQQRATDVQENGFAWPQTPPVALNLATMATSEPVLAGEPDAQLQAPAQKPPTPIAEPATDPVTDSRLSGLRRLAFEQRLAELRRHESEHAPEEEDTTVRQEPASGPQIPVENDIKPAPIKKTTVGLTEPEFLPPPASTEAVKPAKVWSWQTNSYRPNSDDLRILPSRPGQYGRRKS
jgi:uncharacterized protein involved in exopolysaccharide biosynthesis